MRLQFLGATRQVTGSQYCLEVDGQRILVDCGMYQERDFQGRNWEMGPVDPRNLHAILLTHAHLDHCGLLPRLVRNGFRRPIYATSATVDLSNLVLRDSAEIQAEDVAFKRQRHRKEGRQGLHPEMSLYSTKDVERTVSLFRPQDYGDTVEVARGVSARFHDAGHILGSSMIEVLVGEATPRRLIFSGDIGQWDRPIVRDPSTFSQADYLVMESTYGNREHPNHGGVERQLQEVIARTADRGGHVIIPIFAIERAQDLMYYISRLVRSDRIPPLDVFLDSPMAASATKIFQRHGECFDPEMKDRLSNGDPPLKFPGLRVVATPQESMGLNQRRQPAVIMATSGMCVAGRIKHHLRHNITRPECTIVFIGYQGRGTLGRQILDGSPEVRIHGRFWPVRAEIAQIHGFSGHADRSGLLRWLAAIQSPPRQVFLTHGEEEASLALADQLTREKGWPVTVPHYQDVHELD